MTRARFKPTRVTALLASALMSGAAGSAAAATGPSFDCRKAAPGSIEATVCGDATLSQLDRRLADVYAQATAKATNEHPPTLRAEQRGWVKGRNECWKSDERVRCIADAYRLRTAELQARYRLVPFTGPVFYACGGSPANEVVATYFPTDPPVAIVERGDRVSVMFAQPAGSGTKYLGRNESLWEHQGEALVTWGPGAPEMRCVARR